jgi:hypothetical protein
MVSDQQLEPMAEGTLAAYRAAALPVRHFQLPLRDQVLLGMKSRTAHNHTWCRSFWLEHRFAVIFVGIYVAGSMALSPGKQLLQPSISEYYLDFAFSVASLTLVFSGFLVIRELVRHIHDGFKAIPRIATGLRQDYLTPDRILGAVVTTTLLPVFLAAYTVYKTALPTLVPYRWDTLWIESDLLLHGGEHPWRWLSALLHKPTITIWLDSFYFNGWFAIWTGTCVWMVWSRQRELRERFFVSILLTWSLLGTALAYALSSAGPCFLNQLGSQPNPYTPLFDYLREVHTQSPLTALQGQNFLWRVHESRLIQPGCGISAMPSMHLAMMTICMACAWEYNRVLGIAIAVATAIILIGSIQLGWHYAVDGYVAIILTWLIWWGSGRMQKIRRRRASLNMITTDHY